MIHLASFHRKDEHFEPLSWITGNETYNDLSLNIISVKEYIFPKNQDFIRNNHERFKSFALNSNQYEENLHRQ